MLCHLGRGALGSRLMVQELIPIPYSQYQRQTETFVSWPFAEYLGSKVQEIDERGLSVLTIHSHPSGYSDFSSIDDENDTDLFISISGWFDDDRPNGSAIMLPDGSVKARIYSTQGKFLPVGKVCVVGADIKIWLQGPEEDAIPGYALRISQTFGKGTLRLLQQLRIGVLGCSGTGSIVTELLARNCVGKLILVDPDVVEEKNLNRILNTRKIDAKQGLPKVKVLERAIDGMCMGTHVDAYQSDTHNKKMIEVLTDCDVIFGCVDSASGRYHLDCIANAYLTPYFDVGLYLDADQRGGISNADAVAHYVYPESGSLFSRGVYTSKQVAAEELRRTNPKQYEAQRKEGYIQGVEEDQPAVISVNMLAACLAFNDFLARIHGFRLDDNADFNHQRLQLVQGCYLHQDSADKKDNLFPQYLGMGEQSQLIKILKGGLTK